MTTSPDRLMHGDEFGAIRERRFDLDVVDHFWDAIHHLRAGNHLRARLHQFGDGAAVARALDDEVGDDGDRLGMVELDAALEPAARHHGRHRDQELVLFAGRQVHAGTLGCLNYQLSQSRGSGTPLARPSTAVISARSSAASWAQKRAIANPFQAEMPTSPRNEPDSSRIRCTNASSPGTMSAVATLAPPLAIADFPSFRPMSPSSRIVSAKTSLPSRRKRQRSTNSPCIIRSPMAARPNTTISQSSSEALPARSISIRRDSRALSNRMVSCGSHERCEPAAARNAMSSRAGESSAR